MFINKNNDITRYEFTVLLTILFVLVGMVKPIWQNCYEELFEINQNEQVQSTVDIEHREIRKQRKKNRLNKKKKDRLRN